jgi:tagatose-1,6-bisphosphate aldolase non-catalytic subunit AgaZ/GatZ
MGVLMADKTLYAVSVRLNHSASVRYSWAYSETQAKKQVLDRISKQDDIPTKIIYTYFREHPENIIARIETEFKEKED